MKESFFDWSSDFHLCSRMLNSDIRITYFFGFCGCSYLPDTIDINAGRLQKQSGCECWMVWRLLLLLMCWKENGVNMSLFFYCNNEARRRRPHGAWIAHWLGCCLVFRVSARARVGLVCLVVFWLQLHWQTCTF
jgi:hypothetical protein